MNDEIFTKIYSERLRKKGWNPDSEDSLIQLISEAGDLDCIYAATILLRSVGTIKCIPTLKKALMYPKTDVKITSLWTISMIAGHAEQSLYLDCLVDSGYREKMTAMQCVAMYCGEEAADAVAARIKQLLPAKRPRIAWNRDETELTIAAKFIAKFRDRPDTKKAFAHIISRWETLDPKEQKALNEIEGFSYEK